MSSQSNQLSENIFLEADGHDDPCELHDQLHPLLHHVQAVQDNFREDFWSEKTISLFEKILFLKYPEPN